MSLRELAYALVLPVAALTAAAPAAAAPGGGKMPDRGQGAEVHQVRLTELNGSGVSGKAVLIQRDGSLRVQLQARGLVPEMLHPQHIHGLDGAANATCPPMAKNGKDQLSRETRGRR